MNDNTQRTKFQDFIGRLNIYQYSEFRNKVLQRLDPRVSEQTFRNWQNGKYEPDPARRETINAVAVEVTGEKIYN